MEVSTKHVKTAVKVATRERDEVHEIHRRLLQKVKFHEKNHEVMTTKLRQLRKKFTAQRSVARTRGFHELFSYMKQKKKALENAQAKTQNLQKSVDMIGKQLVVHSRKVEVLESSLEDKQLLSLSIGEEEECQEIEEQFIVRRLYEERPVESSPCVMPPQTHEEVRDLSQASHREERSFRECEDVILDANDEKSSRRDDEVCFSVSLSDDEEAAVTLVRTKEREFSLSVEFSQVARKNSSLLRLKSRLSNVLQQSGFILHALEVT